MDVSTTLKLLRKEKAKVKVKEYASGSRSSAPPMLEGGGDDDKDDKKKQVSLDEAKKTVEKDPKLKDDVFQDDDQLGMLKRELDKKPAKKVEELEDDPDKHNNKLPASRNC